MATVTEEMERGEWSCKIDCLWVTLKACVEFVWNVAHITVRSGSLGSLHISLDFLVWLLLYVVGCYMLLGYLNMDECKGYPITCQADTKGK
jgi:hypothetical protein